MVAKDRIIVNVDGKKYEIPLPKDSGLEVREVQNPKCNQEGHICGLFRNQFVCLRLNLKPNEQGQLDLFDMTACSKNPESARALIHALFNLPGLKFNSLAGVFSQKANSDVRGIDAKQKTASHASLLPAVLCHVR